MITDASLQSLKTAIDIVDVIGNYVELKKAGANFKAPCPFHDEKSASFVVSPAKQIYKCFGCQVQGDAIKFVQEYRKLDFVEAVEAIAADMNFSLEYSREAGERKDYARLMEHVNAYYRSGTPPSVTAYLEERGITPTIADAFELGYAPADRNAQITDLKSHMFSLADAVDAGVLGESEHGLYARLTDRVTFPIRNHAGKLVGFGGRILPGSDHPAKYVNSPQTKLFDKSRLLYGYNIAKEHIYKKRTFTVTEGYMDVIMLHQAGIRTAVATMGTALTKEHCNIIKKVPGARVLLCYDGDRAGRAAAYKAAALLSAHEIYGGVVLFPDGMDPADMVKRGDIQTLVALMKQPTPLIPFVITEIAAAYTLSHPEEKHAALRDISVFFDAIPPLIRDEYIGFVAGLLGIDAAHVALPKKAPPAIADPLYGTDVDIPELSVIKAAAEDDAILDIVLDIVTEEDFTSHGVEFRMLLERNPALDGLLLLPQLFTYNLDTLMLQLHIMRIRTLQRQLGSVPSMDTTFSAKSARIAEIKNEIQAHKSKLMHKETPECQNCNR